MRVADKAFVKSLMMDWQQTVRDITGEDVTLFMITPMQPGEAVVTEQGIFDEKEVFDILSAIVEHEFGFERSTIKGSCRKREFVDARKMVTGIMLHLVPAISLGNLGKMMGGRDHSTIIHQRDHNYYMLAKDKKYERRFDTIMHLTKMALLAKEEQNNLIEI